MKYNEGVEMQADSVGLLRSQMYIQRVRLAQEITQNMGKEAGFHCWGNGVSTILNTPVAGGERSMRIHQQGEREFLYAENTGFYEGAYSQILIFTHTHPETGRSAARPRVPAIFPSFSDILSLFHLSRQNLLIAKELHVEPWVNPIAVIAEKEREEVFIFQFDRGLVEKISDEDDFLEHIAEAINAFFKKWYPTKRQSVVYSWVLIGMHLNAGSEAIPHFVTSGKKRCLEFYASIGLTCKSASLNEFHRPDTLAMFEVAMALQSDELEEEDDDEDDEWDDYDPDPLMFGG